jgi:hypothetical protein
MAIGRLVIRRGSIGSLDIGELKVARLTVGELLVERQPTPQPPQPPSTGRSAVAPSTRPT